MKKTLLSLFFSTFIAVFSLTGCGSAGSGSDTGTTPAASPDSVQTESGTVNLTVWVEETNVECTLKMIESFKQQYANEADFDITVVAHADADTKQDLLSDIHNSADVFSMPDDQLYGMIAAGALSPVTNAGAISEENLEDAISAASYKDTLYAYPYSADNGYFLYYDKRYLTDNDVKTLDRILEVASQSAKKVSMDFSSGWYLYSFFGGTGLEFGINPDGVTNHCNWNATDTAIKGVDVTEALLNITSNPGFVAQSNDDFIAGAKSGENIAGIGGVWNAVEIAKYWGEDYGACKLPTYTCAGQQIQMTSFTGYKMMGVNAYSNHTEWAHKLAAWLTNEENQTLRFAERYQGPSNIKASSSDIVKKAPAIAAILEQSQYGTLQGVGAGYWDARSTYGQTIINGNPSNIPLQDLMDTLVRGITVSTVQ